MGFESVAGRPLGLELQQTAIDPDLKIDAGRAHVPNHLGRRLFEQEVQAAVTAAAGRVGKMRRERSLARSSSSGYEDRATAKVALASKHVIELRKPTRDSLR